MLKNTKSELNDTIRKSFKKMLVTLYSKLRNIQLSTSRLWSLGELEELGVPILKTVQIGFEYLTLNAINIIYL